MQSFLIESSFSYLSIPFVDYKKTFISHTCCQILTEMRAFDDYIKHYDELDYDTRSLHSRHLRVKRTLGTLETTPLELKFKALNRFVHL